MRRDTGVACYVTVQAGVSNTHGTAVTSLVTVVSVSNYAVRIWSQLFRSLTQRRFMAAPNAI